MENRVIPLSNLRGGNLYKRHHQQDRENDASILEGESIPLATFLKEEKKKSNFPSSCLGQVSKLCWLQDKQLCVNCQNVHVMSDNVVVASFSRKEHKLELYNFAKDNKTCIITTEEDYFDTDKIVFIGSWGFNLLAYTIPFMDDGEAALVKIDLNTKSTSKVQSWDLTVFWTHKHLTSRTDVGLTNNSIGFETSVSRNGNLLLLTGPSETFGSSSVCKVIDVKTDELLQVIDLEDYKFIHTTAFHPDDNKIAMICSSAIYDYVPTTLPAGKAMRSQNQLISYCISSHKVVAKSGFTDVAPHLLRFSPNGKLIGVKRDMKGAISILCSSSLQCLSLIEQEFSLSPDVRSITNLIFQTFPLFSKDSRQCTVLQKKKKVCGDQRVKKLHWSRGDMWVTRLAVPKVTADVTVDQDHYHSAKRKQQKVSEPSQSNAMYERNKLYWATNPSSGFSHICNKNRLQLACDHSLVQLEDLQDVGYT